MSCVSQYPIAIAIAFAPCVQGVGLRNQKMQFLETTEAGPSSLVQLRSDLACDGATQQIDSFLTLIEQENDNNKDLTKWIRDHKSVISDDQIPSAEMQRKAERLWSLATETRNVAACKALLGAGFRMTEDGTFIWKPF